MVNGRNKGSRGEREFIAILQGVVNGVLGGEAFVLKRNLEQTREGGADVSGAIEPYDIISVEIKRQEKLSVNTWWAQTVKQAEDSNRLPVLAYKQSRSQWTVMMYGHLWRHTKCVRVTVDLDSFLAWYARSLTKIRSEKRI